MQNAGHPSHRALWRQPLGVEMGPRTYRMAGVQLGGIAKAMLPRLPSLDGGFWVTRATASEVRKLSPTNDRVRPQDQSFISNR